MRIGYVISKTSNRAYALAEDNVIEACFGGTDPLADAKSYARDYTKATDDNTYVYRVSVESVTGYKVTKDVVAFATPDA